MTQNINWWALDSRNPIEGNPPEISTAADDYLAIGKAIADAVHELKQFSDKAGDKMISQAIDKVRQDAANVQTGLETVHTRYTVVAGSLSNYAASLAKAQDKADEAEREAQNAKAAKQAADAAVSNYQDQVNLYRTFAVDRTVGQILTLGILVTQQDVDDNARNLRVASNHLADAKADQAAAQKRLDAAQEKLDQAKRDRDTAANDAASTIDTYRDGMNDNWFEEAARLIVGVVEDIVNNIADAIAKVAAALSKLANALAKLMQDGWKLLTAIGTEGWGKALEQVAKDVGQVMAAYSELASALSSVISILATVLSFIPLPAFKLASLALTGLSLGLKAISVIVDAELAVVGVKQWSDVGYGLAQLGLMGALASLKVVTGGIPAFGNFAAVPGIFGEGAAGLFKIITAPINIGKLAGYDQMLVNPSSLNKSHAFGNADFQPKITPYVYKNPSNFSPVTVPSSPTIMTSVPAYA